MPTRHPKSPASKRVPQFNEVITPALPLAPAISEGSLSNRRAMAAATLALLGFLLGLAIGLGLTEKL